MANTPKMTITTAEEEGDQIGETTTVPPGMEGDPADGEGISETARRAPKEVLGIATLLKVDTPV